MVQGAELEPDMGTGPGTNCWTARSFSFLICEMECGRMRHRAPCSETTHEGVGRAVLGSENQSFQDGFLEVGFLGAG